MSAPVMRLRRRIYQQRRARCRARADELEGLLVDSQSSEEGWRDDDAAADADAISLHWHLGHRGRWRVPPRTPRHISLWGFNLFGSGRGRGAVALEGGDDVLHSAATASTAAPGAGAADAPPKRTGKKRRGSRSGASTDDLLTRAALEPTPTQLKDVSAADVERRARSGSTASQREGGGETEQERRTRRKARKEMRRLAVALAEPHPPEFEGFPGSGPGELPPQLTFRAPPPGYNGIPSPFMRTPSPTHEVPPADALAHLAAQDDEDAADLDGLAYARLAPRGVGGSQSQSRSSGRSSNSGSGAPYSPIGGHHPGANPGEIAYIGIPHHKPKKSKSKSKSGRSTKSKSSATSSTLASPPPSASRATFPQGVRDSGVYPDSPKGEEFGAFATAAVEGGEEEFDGTPGGLDSFDDFAEVRREALPSPGLSRGSGGFNFGKGMGGF
ncbi:hypothetical protein MVEN_01403600 [Mycena venus]|uniref:Uncharacterized protein n=1 Tax=Mycena venus TaxID=2733690 RepID=A0A8H7CUU5_9AGAR|nr:hypothetical protein MVEN_01403600 [Mycena venus]